MIHNSWQHLCIWLIAPLVVSPVAYGAQQSVAQKRLSQGQVMTLLESDKISLDLGGTTADTIEKPLALALNQLLEPSDEPETPLNNARDVALNSPDEVAKVEAKPKLVGAPAIELERARDVLRSHFNRPTTQMVLLKSGLEGRGFQPERGEDIKENWVFSLLIPTLSDHIYWVVVSKDKVPKAYVYGFN